MPIAAPPVTKQISKACALLRLPEQDATARAAQERAVVDAISTMDFQMDRFASGRQLTARSLKAEKKWLGNFLKAHAALPASLNAPGLDRHVEAYADVWSLKRDPPQKRQLSAERKRLAASMAHDLLRKYGFKLTGHRQGKFCRLAGILYNGDPRANCYRYCCELLQKKKASSRSSSMIAIRKSVS